MSTLKKIFPVNKKDFIHAGEASINIKNLLKSLNTDAKLMRRISICGYEGEMNVVMHGGEGDLALEIDKESVVLDISDNGPGIDNVELAMCEGYSTASEKFRKLGFGAGMGLPNMKRNSDVFAIESEKGKGTFVRMVFYIEPSGEGHGR